MRDGSSKDSMCSRGTPPTHINRWRRAKGSWTGGGNLIWFSRLGRVIPTPSPIRFGPLPYIGADPYSSPFGQCRGSPLGSSQGGFHPIPFWKFSEVFGNISEPFGLSINRPKLFRTHMAHFQKSRNASGTIRNTSGSI
jgi:hypothetical protein